MNVDTASPLPYEPVVTVVFEMLKVEPVNVKPVPAVYEPAPEN